MDTKIHGIITDKKQHSLKDVRIHLFSVKALTEDDYLGEAKSNSKGHFTIIYRQDPEAEKRLKETLKNGAFVFKVYNNQKEVIHLTKPVSVRTLLLKPISIVLDFEEPPKKDFDLPDIYGTVVDGNTKQQLKGIYLRLFAAHAMDYDDYLAEGTTDNSGNFKLAPRISTKIQTILETAIREKSAFILAVYNEGNLIQFTEPRPLAELEKPYMIEITSEPDDKRSQIRQIGEHIGLSKETLKEFENNAIVGAKDLFTTKGAEILKKIDLPPEKRRALLNGAKLTAVSNNIGISMYLVDQGFTSLSRLGRLPLARIASMMKQFGEKEQWALKRLYDHARYTGTIIAQTVTTYKNTQNRGGNWLLDRIAAGQSEKDKFLIPIIDGIISDYHPSSDENENCADCADCAHIFSLLAYLFDLVDFIYDNFDLSSNTLEKILLQEIDSLDCEAGITPTFQIRLAIMVLEKYLVTMNRPAPGNEWVQVYKETGQKFLNLLELSESLPPAGQRQTLDTALNENAPKMRHLDTIVTQVRQFRYQKIEDTNPYPPEPAADADSETYYNYEQELNRIDNEKLNLRTAFEEQIAIILRPALEGYREMLVKQAGKPVAQLENLLFIDLRSAACQLTTPIMQAIHSLQSFVLAVRTGEINQIKKDGHLNSLIKDTNFYGMDEIAWQQLESYQAWVSAIYVTVYPENFLAPPTLRRTMTPGFQEVVNSLTLLPGKQQVDDTLEAYKSHQLQVATLQLLNAYRDERYIYVFAQQRARNALWLNKLDRQTDQWSGWLPFKEWNPDSRPEEIRFIDYRVSSDENYLGKFIVKTTANEYIVVTANGSVEDHETDDSGTGNVDDNALIIEMFDNTRPPWPAGIVGSAETTLFRLGYVDDTGFFVTGRIDFDPWAGSFRTCISTANPTRVEEVFAEDEYIICQSTHGIIATRFTMPSWNHLEKVGQWHVVSGSIPAQVNINASSPLPDILKHVYTEERYLHFPLLAAWILNRAGDFSGAHEWYLRLYNPFKSSNTRWGFPFEQFFNGAFERPEDWLDYARDPYAIASQRAGVYLRHIILMMVKNVLDWADSEYALATSEHINRARELYLLAEQILQAPELDNPCQDKLRVLEFEIIKERGLPALKGLIRQFEWLQTAALATTTVKELRQAFEAKKTTIGLRKKLDEIMYNHNGASTGSLTFVERRAQHDQILEAIESKIFENEKGNAWFTRILTDTDHITRSRFMASKPELDYIRNPLKEARLVTNISNPELSKGDLERIHQHNLAVRRNAYRKEILAQVGIVSGIEVETAVIDLRQTHTLAFCIPTNPLLEAYASRIALSLENIRNCRSLTGDELPQTSTPDQSNGLGAFTDLGQLPQFDSPSPLTPPRYRYAYLVEKARQQAAFAQQLGSALLVAVEKWEKERFDILVAEHQKDIARATINLKNLFVTEAENAYSLALEQKQRAETQYGFWEDRITNDWISLSGLEIGALLATGVMGFIQNIELGIRIGTLIGGSIGALVGGSSVATVGAALSGGTGAVAGLPGAGTGAAIGAIAGGVGVALLGAGAAVLPQLAAFERRTEDWELQRDLSRIDVDIAETQITLADDKVNIASEDKRIAELQHTHATAVLEYLRHEKIANKDLYEWMIQVLVENYRTIMQIATGTALLAQQALAFERRGHLNFIQGNYWAISHEDLRNEQKDLGLLGAERLLTDLTRLDNDKLINDKRRLHLSKTISLTTFLPTEFVEFKQTGRITFNTLMEWFDRDFPGHYMRLIKNLKVTVLALVPGIEGIHATLRNGGTSWVVTEQSGFSKVAMSRFSEMIALDAAINDSGVFVLDYNDPMLLPFEGLGVETQWTFELPRATNNFHFDTIMDILFTLEYTALHSDAHRDMIIERLGHTFSSDVVMNLRTTYPDQWYHLHNPQDVRADQTVTIELTRYAFPPKLESGLSSSPEVFNESSDLKVLHVTAVFTSKDGAARPGFRDDSGNALLSLVLRKENIELELLPHNNEDGVFSTRVTGQNPFNNIDPIGEWQLTAKPAFFTGDYGQRPIDQIGDILLILTIEGPVEW